MFGALESPQVFHWGAQALHVGEETMVAERMRWRHADHDISGVARYEDVERVDVAGGRRPSLHVFFRNGEPAWRFRRAPRAEAEWAARMIERRLSAVRRAEQPSFASAVPLSDLQSACNTHLEDAVALTDLLLLQSVHHGATDLHLEPHSETVRVRLRRHGMLQEVAQLPVRAFPPLLTRIKVVAGLPLERAATGQESRMRVRAGERLIDMRVSCLPTLHGEKVTIRLFDPKTQLLSLPELGMTEPSFSAFLESITQPQGAVVVTGPSNSGKTTTMYAALLHLREQSRHLSSIVTVEDPVEHDLQVIHQTQVEPQRGLTFAAALRTVLRQDPEVIMLGEVRDAETAEIVVQAALTGHLIFTTVHARSAPAVFVRLVEMGLEPFTVASAITGVMAQRLVRRLCPECRQEEELQPELLGDLRLEGMALPETHFVSAGCDACDRTGYVGRTGVFAWLPVTASLRDAILRRATIDEMEAVAADSGADSLLAAGLAQVAAGVTSVEELHRVLPRPHPTGGEGGVA